MALLFSTKSGKDFKELYSYTKFYKITNKNECHHNFQYKDGLNEDTQKFNPVGECKSGGLYFTELYNIPYWTLHGLYIREVEILDDSLVYIEYNKFKTNKFYLKEKILLNDFNKWHDFGFCYDAYKINRYNMLYIKSKDFITCMVQQIGLVLQDVPLELQTYELCKLAVKSNGLSIRFVPEKFKTYELCKLAVKNNYNKS